MGMFSNLNKGVFKVQFPKKCEYKSLCDLFNDFGEDTIYTIQGLYVNTKGKYGDSIVCLCKNDKADNIVVNFPKHLTDSGKRVIHSNDCINAINDGKAGFRIKTYNDSDNVLRYSIEWLDL